MPTYSYACTDCGDRFDVVQAFTDDALSTCEKCSGRLRKLFNSVGVVFKGSGFYRTDSRESAKSSTNGSAKTGSSSGTDTSSSGEKSSSSESSSTSSTKSDSASAKSASAAAS
ncbi:FmdB family zinc ribbon protein [Mycobacterium sp.]|uniref:FmdB family zinc ribbon protein n=1 Tax=Mycobacterium sp. TaxID=1785 RepID=UPI003C71402B